MDRGAQPGIAYQMLGVFKAVNVTDGGQHGHRSDHTKSRQMNQVRNLIVLGADLLHHGRQTRQLALSKMQGVEITLQVALFQFTQRQSQPPRRLIGAEGIAFRGAR